MNALILLGVVLLALAAIIAIRPSRGSESGLDPALVDRVDEKTP